MNDLLKEFIVCPKCQSTIDSSAGNSIICSKCKSAYPLQNGIPIFSEIPISINPSEKIERNAHSGTRWRQANWRFLEKQIENLKADSVVLDVGAGRGDFGEIYKNHKHITLDIFPYPEVDVACDLSDTVPFLDNCFDCVLLMNVCEHIYDPKKVLSSIHKVLKPNGKVIIAIPFFIKIHQAPFDFNRFTHFALQKMSVDTGFRIETIEGFFDAAGLIQETIRYFRFWEIPKLQKLKRILVKPIIILLTLLGSLLEIIGGSGKIEEANHYDFPAPIGYHLVLSKPESESLQ